jgi:hypothetical protein
MIVADLAVARRCGWRYEWVRDLEVDVYHILLDELAAEAAR